MKALLLAAGLGTRLSPITNTIPKCLVPINGRPLLELWIEKLVALGVDEILINTHYFAEQVELFISNSPHKSKVILVKEKTLLGTGGTLIKNKTFWKDDTTLIIHADNYCEDNLLNLIKTHNKRPEHCDATLLIFNTNTPKSCGIVSLDEMGVICEFYEKSHNPPSNLASGALFVFTPNIYKKYLAHFKENKEYEISIDFIPLLLKKLYSYQTKQKYVDIGTPKAYQSVQS